MHIDHRAPLLWQRPRDAVAVEAPAVSDSRSEREPRQSNRSKTPRARSSPRIASSALAAASIRLNTRPQNQQLARAARLHAEQPVRRAQQNYLERINKPTRFPGAR